MNGISDEWEPEFCGKPETFQDDNRRLSGGHYKGRGPADPSLQDLGQVQAQLLRGTVSSALAPKFALLHINRRKSSAWFRDALSLFRGSWDPKVPCRPYLTRESCWDSKDSFGAKDQTTTCYISSLFSPGIWLKTLKTAGN